MEKLARNEDSTLLRKFVNYSSKTFIGLAVLQKVYDRKFTIVNYASAWTISYDHNL